MRLQINDVPHCRDYQQEGNEDHGNDYDAYRHQGTSQRVHGQGRSCTRDQEACVKITGQGPNFQDAVRPPTPTEFERPPTHIRRHANITTRAGLFEARLPLLIAHEAQPTMANWITTTRGEKNEFRRMLDTNQLIPAPEHTNTAYLKTFAIPKKDPEQARVLVDGKEAKLRGMLQPAYPADMSVPSAVRKLLRHRWFAALDLSGAYFQVRPQDDPALLTTRINGRLYTYTGCPQGLASSPQVCIERFTQWFRDAGATAWYVDNAAFGADTRQEAQDKLDRAITTLHGYGLHLSSEQTVQPTTRLPFLGLIISQNRLDLTPEKRNKLQRVLDLQDGQKLQGFLAYLHDVFGTEGGIRTTRTFTPATIYTDGAKGLLSAAGAFCNICNGLIRGITLSAKTASQTASECQALLLGFKLLRWFPSAPIITDALYLVHAAAKNKGFSLAYAAAQQGPPATWCASADNKADSLSRGARPAPCACT